MRVRKHLTLGNALENGQLAEFIAQAEANGTGSTTRGQFDEAVRRLVTPPLSPDRTSRSASDGALSEK